MKRLQARETLVFSDFPIETLALRDRLCGLPVTGPFLLIPQNGIKSHSVALLQSSLDAQTQTIPPYCRDGNRSPLPAIYGAGIVLFQLASYFTALPGCRVPDIRDRDVIMLAPEKRRFAVSAADAEHRTRNCLSLALRHHPVLYARRFAGNGVRISRHIARCKHIGSAGPQRLADNNPVIYLYAGRFRQ